MIKKEKTIYSSTIDNYDSATFLKGGVNPMCPPSIILNSPQDPQIIKGKYTNVVDPAPKVIQDFIGGYLESVNFTVEGREMIVYFDDNGIAKGLLPNIAFAQMYGTYFSEQHNTFLFGNVVVMTDVYHEKYQEMYSSDDIEEA